MNSLFHSAGRVFVVGLLAVACERTAESDRPARVINQPVTSTGREVASATREVARTTGNAIENTAEAVRREVTPESDRAGNDRAGNDRDRTVTPNSGATTAAFNAAIDDIASARCEREQRCNNVGSGKRFESLGACRTVVRASFSDDLNPSECRAGIDRSELQECMQEVRDESCGNPIDSLQRVVACRTTDLCRNTTISLR